jgi:hypothetical protein
MRRFMPLEFALVCSDPEFKLASKSNGVES